MDQNEALNRAERQRLRDIERGITQDDPDFAAEFAEIELSDEFASPSGQQRIIWLSVLGVLGIGSLVAGLILASPIIGLFGFAMTVLAASRLAQKDRVAHAFRSLVGLVVDTESRE